MDKENLIVALFKHKAEIETQIKNTEEILFELQKALYRNKLMTRAYVLNTDKNFASSLEGVE